MKTSFTGAAAAAALAAALAAPPSVAQAAAVTLTGWAYGGGSTVASTTHSVSSMTSYAGWAGGFRGSLAGAGALDTSQLVTYCIELEEAFSFSSSAMTGYSVADAASYFAARRLANPLRPDGAQVAERLGRLFSWVQGDATRVDTAAESTALQLAVWNIVYDDDWSLFNPSGRFSDGSSHAMLANIMMANASFTTNRLNVFALTRAGKQDFVVTTLRVPSPGSLALAALGLAALTALRRRA
jgi:MYXO-CTERM domain-containing protein